MKREIRFGKKTKTNLLLADRLNKALISLKDVCVIYELEPWNDAKAYKPIRKPRKLVSNFVLRKNETKNEQPKK